MPIKSTPVTGNSLSRVFLNLWFAKPMVWVRVAFHENNGNHENDENGEDNSDSYKQGVECLIRGNHGNHENDENHENPGCKPRVPQTIGLEIPEVRGVFFSRRRTNVQQLTCKIDLSRSFYYLFFSFVLIELKPFVLKGKSPGGKILKKCDKSVKKYEKIMKRFCPLVVAL